ncbi:RluA family pseudouridine synthase [bacterium]|nr:RluA family pseudouridine synthase [bacterium]
MKRIELKVAPNIIGRKRLDLFVVESGVGLSRSQVRKLIGEKRIYVEGKGAKPGFILHGGETVVIELPDEVKQFYKPENIPIDIVYEDNYIVVVNKPAGMVVHPAPGNLTGTLVNAMLYHTRLSDEKVSGRPGVVHRLDKDTTGLLIMAKDTKAHLILAEAIRRREVKREYIAVIWGGVPDKGEIFAPIGRDPHNRLKMAVVSNGKVSHTEYTLIARFSFLSLVRVRLKTGRTHQIRVHFSHIGHPIFGDPVYGGRETHLAGIIPEAKAEAKSLLSLIERQALHAHKLSFRHPITNEKLEFLAPLPEDMKSVIDKLIEEDGGGHIEHSLIY